MVDLTAFAFARYDLLELRDPDEELDVMVDFGPRRVFHADFERRALFGAVGPPFNLRFWQSFHPLSCSPGRT